MNMQKDNSPYQSFLGSHLALGVAVILLGILGYSLIAMIPKQKRAETAKREAEMELRELEEKKTSLEQEISLLSSDFGREKAFREKFGVVKEGEEIVVLVDDDTAPLVEEKGGLWNWIKNLFSGKGD